MTLDEVIKLNEELDRLIRQARLNPNTRISFYRGRIKARFIKAFPLIKEQINLGKEVK